jgi:hypothetical protein
MVVSAIGIVLFGSKKTASCLPRCTGLPCHPRHRPPIHHLAYLGVSPGTGVFLCSANRLLANVGVAGHPFQKIAQAAAGYHEKPRLSLRVLVAGWLFFLWLLGIKN